MLDDRRSAFCWNERSSFFFRPVDVARRRPRRARFSFSQPRPSQKLTRAPPLSRSPPFAFPSVLPLALNRITTTKSKKKTEIGVGLTAFGVLFTFLGVAFFFDRGLLAMGNLLFLSGVALTIGPRATLRFFTRRKNMRVSFFFFGGGGGRERRRSRESDEITLSPLVATHFFGLIISSLPFDPKKPLSPPSQGSSIFAGGIFLVLMGWAATGMAVEAYGFWLLFAGFFPTVLGFLRRAPVLGPLLDNPGVKRALNKVAPAQSLPM